MEHGTAQTNPIQPGLYRHYKGGLYSVLSVALHTETQEEMVVYKTSNGTLCVRPRAMFEESVTLDSQSMPRFSFLKSEDDLAARMHAAGMRSIEEMLATPGLSRLCLNVHVTDLDSFEWWLKSRYEDYLRMQARKTLDKQEGDELYEWVLAHSSVFGSIYHAFLAATGRGPKE